MSLEQNIQPKKNPNVVDVKEALKNHDIDLALNFASKVSGSIPNQKEESIVSNFSMYEKMSNIETHFPHSPEALNDIRSMLDMSLV